MGATCKHRNAVKDSGLSVKKLNPLGAPLLGSTITEYDKLKMVFLIFWLQDLLQVLAGIRRFYF